MEKFDVLYWADHIIRYGLGIRYEHKVRQGNVFKISGHMNRARLINCYQAGVFILTKEETSIFMDRLVQQNYPDREILQSALGEAENESYLDSFPFSKSLDHILFLRSGNYSFRTYRFDDLKYLGVLNRGSKMWTDIYLKRNRELFFFIVEKETPLSDYTMEEFLRVRSSKNFPEKEYEKLIYTIKGNPRRMHSSVREFLDQCPRT